MLNLGATAAWEIGKAVTGRVHQPADPTVVAVAERLGILLEQDVDTALVKEWLGDPALWNSFATSLNTGLDDAALQLRRLIGPAVTLDAARQAVAEVLTREALLGGDQADWLRHAKELDAIEQLRRAHSTDLSAVLSDLSALKDGQAFIYELLTASMAAATPVVTHAAAGSLIGPLDPEARCPFRPGTPLSSTEPIFGRDDELLQVRRHLDEDGSVNIVGARRSGKTSLLRHVAARVERSRLVHSCTLQAQIGSGDDMYRGVLDGWAVHCPPQAQPYQVLFAWLRARPGMAPVLIIDEFERSLDDTRFDSFNFHDGLRALAESRRVLLVLSTTKRVSELRLPEGTSPLATALLPVEVAGLSEPAMRDCLAQPSPHPFTTERADQVIAWSNRNPCRLQTAAHAWFGALQAGDTDPESVRRRFEYRVEQTCFTGGNRR